MVVLTNYALEDVPGKLNEADLIMCPENTPEEVYHFIRLCKETMAELITNIQALCRSKGVTFRLDV